MRSGLPALSFLGGIAAFASCGLALSLLGLGLPYVVGAAISGGCAGLLIYSLGRWALERSQAAPPVQQFANPQSSTFQADRLAALERELSGLRHELRGALSPALMVTDRLLRSDDPAIRRAGDAVVRSVQRATDLIGPDARAESAVTPPAG